MMHEDVQLGNRSHGAPRPGRSPYRLSLIQAATPVESDQEQLKRRGLPRRERETGQRRVDPVRAQHVHSGRVAEALQKSSDVQKLLDDNATPLPHLLDIRFLRREIPTVSGHVANIAESRQEGPGVA